MPDLQTDYHAVADAMGEDWDVLLKNWMAANYINSGTGVHGYKGEIMVTTHTAPAGKTKISLYPGEGVYSKTDGGEQIPTSTQGSNIRYAGLATTGISESGTVSTAGRLLTYNIKTEAIYNADGRLKDPETGSTTGKAANVNITPGRSVTSSYSGPYRIGAGDMLFKNGERRDYPLWDIQDK